jgi:magnesium chelatase subunit H
MKPKPTSKVDRSAAPVRMVILTLDHHIAGAVERARRELVDELPGLELRLHAATQFSDPDAVAAAVADIETADLVFANMLFIDEHIRAVLPALTARRERCDAMVCTMSASEVMRLTRMGDFRMDQKKGLGLMRKLRRGRKSQPGGAGQLAMLRRIPKILSLIPGKAQDLRAYFLVMSYWLSGSSDNLADMVRMLVNRYADGERRTLRGTLNVAPPRAYPENGLYHPDLAERITEAVSALPRPEAPRGTIGVLLMRSYVLAHDTQHYDGVLAALEARGYRVIPAFASGLDSRPAIREFFFDGDRVAVDAVVSLTGFSLVGGPAFNDAKAAEQMLAELDVPYIAAQPLEFQSVREWQSSTLGLTPLEATIMVAIPELDGATGPIAFGGRDREAGSEQMVPITDRVERLADRVDRQVRLRLKPRAERDLAIVLFNFPPNAGATGTAAFLSVFESLHRTLAALAEAGYDVEVPDTVDDLRAAVLNGNAERYGTDANVVAKLDVDDYVVRSRHLGEIEAQWGSAPGRLQTDGRSLFVLGARFGRVLVGVQPAFGYEGDPMRLLYESSFAPTHAFTAFYQYLREDFGADAVLHFGTHGALEFMPGKQVCLSEACWPDRLIGDLPNLYLYASNNPSEGALARRRGAATLISYLTPPIRRSGLYRELQALRETVDRYRGLDPTSGEAERLVPLIHEQAEALDLSAGDLDAIVNQLVELERTLIPTGLHVLGEPMSESARVEYLGAIAEAHDSGPLPDATLAALVAGESDKRALKAGGLKPTERARALCATLRQTAFALSKSAELDAVVTALDGRFIRPAPGGDLLRNPDVLPTGRNLHGFDPFALPDEAALRQGQVQAERLLATHRESSQVLPESIAIVLWGADNLKSGGAPIGQALALLGARPRLDSYGRLCGAELIPLETLGRPRIDVLMTLSGIFRDLLPLQTRLLAEAAWLAASADEPPELNFVRRNTLAYQAEHGVDLETAALRVFSNKEGAYGANVNLLVDGGTWQDEDELGDAYAKRKCFAYRANGTSVEQQGLLKSALGRVDLAYQNLESIELGVTTIDHYFDTLGGIGRAASMARGGEALPVYIGDETQGKGTVRTLEEQVGLESRTRSLNPKWAEEMLKHGAEGVRQIEAQVTNTLGWSATTSQVQPWVYRELTKTYVLDEAMRERLSKLNPKASLKLAQRLIEASERSYWEPDEETMAALYAAGDELEDTLEGVPNEGITLGAA